MKKQFTVVLFVLAIFFVPFFVKNVSATPTVSCSVGSSTSIIMEDQDASGAILSDNGIQGTFVYCVSDHQLNYAFSGTVPVGNDWYALVVGEDPILHPETSVIINYPRSNGDTNEITVSGSIELNRNFANAKVWFVLGGDVMLLPRYEGFTGWNSYRPQYYLFGTSLMNYQDIDITPLCADSDWSCTDWNICLANGTQDRTCSKISNCEGGVLSPATSQSCTYVPPICTSFTYSDWGACQSNNTKTRMILTQSPENCVGGNPTLIESCVYAPLCTASDWSCGDWGPCSRSGQKNRTCNKISNCEGGAPSPETVKSCRHGRQCEISDWSCGNWSACSSRGTKTRTCSKTFECKASHPRHRTITKIQTTSCNKRR